MGSLLAEGNKKDRVDQYKLVAKMRFYGFREVEFLFKTFKCAYSKSLALLFEVHTHAEYWAKNNELGISVIL
ncbi:hypothetical protein HpDR79_14600 [Helicobacter pylori]